MGILPVAPQVSVTSGCGGAEGSEILSTRVLPDVMATAVVTAETLRFPLPTSGPAAARCPGTLSSYLGSCCFLLE